MEGRQAGWFLPARLARHTESAISIRELNRLLHAPFSPFRSRSALPHPLCFPARLQTVTLFSPLLPSLLLRKRLRSVVPPSCRFHPLAGSLPSAFSSFISTSPRFSLFLPPLFGYRADTNFQFCPFPYNRQILSRSSDSDPRSRRLFSHLPLQRDSPTGIIRRLDCQRIVRCAAMMHRHRASQL